MTKRQSKTQFVCDEVIHAEGEDRLFPIRSSTFVSGCKVPFPLYVRLNSLRFRRVLQAGSVFDSALLKRYLDQGVERFYVPIEFEASYLAFCDRKNFLQRRVRKKTFFHGDVITEMFLNIQGVDRADIQFAKAYVEQVFDLVTRLELTKQNDAIDKLLKANSPLNHAIRVVAVASVIGLQFGLDSSKSIQILGLAALLGDIGLIGMPDSLLDENEEELSDEERKKFRAHPIEGSKIIQKLQGVAPMVAQTVLMHHLRRDGSGFPCLTGAKQSQVTEFSEIVGMADAYVHFMKNHSIDHDGVRYHTIYQEKVLSPFASDIRDAFLHQFPTPVLGAKRPSSKSSAE